MLRGAISSVAAASSKGYLAQRTCTATAGIRRPHARRRKVATAVASCARFAGHPH